MAKASKKLTVTIDVQLMTKQRLENVEQTLLWYDTIKSNSPFGEFKGEINIKVAATPDGVGGIITQNGKTYPFEGTTDGSTWEGKFTDGDKSFDCTAEVENDILKFTVGEQLFELKRERMHVFKGGRLEWEYRPLEKRAVPKIASLVIPHREVEDNMQQIVDWAEDQEDLQLQVVHSDKREVILTFPEKIDDREIQEDVESALYEARFRYEIT